MAQTLEDSRNLGSPQYTEPDSTIDLACFRRAKSYEYAAQHRVHVGGYFLMVRVSKRVAITSLPATLSEIKTKVGGGL